MRSGKQRDRVKKEILKKQKTGNFTMFFDFFKIITLFLTIILFLICLLCRRNRPQSANKHTPILFLTNFENRKIEGSSFTFCLNLPVASPLTNIWPRYARNRTSFFALATRAGASGAAARYPGAAPIAVRRRGGSPCAGSGSGGPVLG